MSTLPNRLDKLERAADERDQRYRMPARALSDRELIGVICAGTGYTADDLTGLGDEALDQLLERVVDLGDNATTSAIRDHITEALQRGR